MKKSWQIRLALLVLCLTQLTFAASFPAYSYSSHVVDSADGYEDDPVGGGGSTSLVFGLTKKIPDRSTSSSSSSSSSSAANNSDLRYGTTGTRTTAGRDHDRASLHTPDGRTKGRRRADASTAAQYVLIVSTTASKNNDNYNNAGVVPLSSSFSTSTTSESSSAGRRPLRRSSAWSLRRKLAKEEEEVVVVEEADDEKDDTSSTSGGGEGGSLPSEILDKTKSPTLFPVTTKSPVQSPAMPMIEQPTTTMTSDSFPVAPPPPPVFISTTPPTYVPVTTTLYVPPTSSLAPISPAPIDYNSATTIPAPTVYPIRFVLTSPSAVPATTKPAVLSSSSSSSSVAPPSDASSSSSSSVAPTFDNNRQTESLTLNNFAVSVRADVDDALDLDERAVVHVFRVDLRKAAQVYLKQALPYKNLLYVQLHPLEGRRRRGRRNLLDIAESFEYGGEAVFLLHGAPDRDELLFAQQQALNDTTSFQGYIHQTPTLIDVELVQAVFRDDPELKEDTALADKLLGGKVSLIAVIAVASGMALAVLLLIVAMICKLYRRQRHSAPPPVITAAKNGSGKGGDEFSPYGDGTHRTDTDDEGAKPLEQLPRRLDLPNSASNVTGETHTVGGTFSSDTSEQPSKKNARDTLANILRTKKRVPARPYSVPVIERADSGGSMDGSMDGYSLESGRQGQQQQQPQQQRPSQDRFKSITKPSWGSPSTVSVYTAENESQFSYSNIPGITTNNNKPPSAVSALGSALDSDSLDDDLVVTRNDGNNNKTRAVPVAAPPKVRQAPSTAAVSSPLHTKTSSEGYEDDEDMSFVVPPLEGKERVTNGFEDQDNAARDNMPFDESIEDSIEQDLDVFSAELEKIKRDIAARRKERSSSSGDNSGAARWSRR